MLRAKRFCASFHFCKIHKITKNGKRVRGRVPGANVNHSMEKEIYNFCISSFTPRELIYILIYERREQREENKCRKRLEKWRWPAQWTRDGKNGGHEWSGGSWPLGRLEQHFEENESLPRETRWLEFRNKCNLVNSIYILITNNSIDDTNCISISREISLIRFR